MAPLRIFVVAVSLATAGAFRSRPERRMDTADSQLNEEAFVPSKALKVTADTAAAQRSSAPRTLSMGYVPDGLTPAQYKKLQAGEAKTKALNKKTKQKGSVETLTEWQARSAKKFKNQPGAGHVYVKIRGGEIGDKRAKKGDASAEALTKDGFGRGVKGRDRLVQSGKAAAAEAPAKRRFR